MLDPESQAMWDELAAYGEPTTFMELAVAQHGPVLYEQLQSMTREEAIELLGKLQVRSQILEELTRRHLAGRELGT